MPRQRQSTTNRTYANQTRGYKPYMITRTYKRKVSGKGAYTVDNGPWANRGAAFGRYVGNYFGHPLASRAGEWIGRRVFHRGAKLFGSGAYTQVSDGTPAASVMAPQVPAFTANTKDDSVVITHKEYLGDILTSSSPGGFSINSYGLNPSEMNTFPWLSNIAYPNYQQYKFEGLVFEFKSFSADALNSTNTALGSVFACINYDYSDANLSSRYEVENTDWSQSCKPSENMLIPVECKPRQTIMGGLLYVLNTNNVPPGNDPKTYYLGKLWIGTTGFQGTNVNIGSLYVTYKIRLYKPIMTRPLSNALFFMASRAGCDVANPIGISTIPTTSYADSIGITLGTSSFVMAKERLVIGQVFEFTYVWSGAITANISRPTQASSLGNYNIGAGGVSTLVTTPDGVPNTGCSKLVLTFYCTVLDNNSDITVVLSGGTLPGAPCFLDIVIRQICGTPYNTIGVYTP